VTAAIDELNEAQRNPSDEHKAAMPSVTVLSDPIREQNEQAAENQRKLDADVHAAAADKADAQGARAGAAKPRDDADAASPPPAEQAESDDDEDDRRGLADGTRPRRRGRPRKSAE
jgi:hypothetical protein